MQILKYSAGKKNIIKQTLDVIKNKGIVVYPTDTVYGLAVRADSNSAVKKLLAFKDRPMGKAISIAIPSLNKAQKYVKISQSQKLILQTLLPGPYTIILKSKHEVSHLLEAEDGTLGIRIPDDEFVSNLTKNLSFPITATSANITGKGPHYSIKALLNTLSQKKRAMIDLIIDKGALPHRPPSTVMRMTNYVYETIRKGRFIPTPEFQWKSISEQQTREYARKLVNHYLPVWKKQPCVIILQGEMGAGKTVFVQGIGKTLGIREAVVSPTFVMYYEYQAHNPVINHLHHFDLYRSENKQDIELLNIPSLLKKGELVAIEWGEKLGSLQSSLLKKAYMLIVTIAQNKNKRTIYVSKITQ